MFVQVLGIGFEETFSHFQFDFIGFETSAFLLYSNVLVSNRVKTSLK